MFSYLHGIRPNSRRSAPLSAAPPPQNTSSRYYHERPTHPVFNLDHFVTPTSQSTSLTESSPVSSEPPILPPIPRVASRGGEQSVDADNDNGHRGDYRMLGTQKRSPRETPPIPPMPTSSQNHRPSNTVKDRSNKKPEGSTVTTVPSSVSSALREVPPSRSRRPIDVAFESMRSYSEPPSRQSLGLYHDNSTFLPDPNRGLPPPPHQPLYLQPQPRRQAPPPPQSSRVPEQVQSVTNQHRLGKTKLNLLNPMSLLARRRSSQAVEEAYSQNQTTPGLRLPDDYDPRIRGKVVHDFSAPRASRTASSNEVNVPQTQAKERRGSSVLSQKKVSPRPGSSSTLEDDSPSSQEREHTPVFKENFDDDVEPWTSDMDSEANRRTSAFMYQVSLQASQPSPDPSSLPAFARNLPPHVSSKNADSSHNASSPPSKAPLKVVLVMPLSNLDSGRCSPPTSPPKARSRATSVTDSSLQALGSPQRYKSNASRFSFDLAGLGSAAQEKLLEEKHRQKAKRRERESVTSDNNGLDDGKYDDEYADYDDMDDDDSLEERIPGVNANAEDLDMPVLQQATEVTFISPNKSSFESAASAVSTGLTSPGTPKDIQSQLAGFAVSKSSPNLTKLQLEKSQSSMKGNDSRPSSLPGGAVASKFDSHTFDRVGTSGVSSAGRTNRFDHQDEDDMYFDDGMIEDLDDQEGQALDESVFDDDMSRTYGLPLRDMKPFATPDDQKTLFNYQFQMGQLRSQNTVMHDRIDVAPSPSKSPEDDAAIAELRDSVTDLKQPARASFSYTAGLTRDNLGLHDQLAMAANQAALDGKFNRSYSQGSTQESNDGLDSSVWINPLNSQDQQHMIDFPQSEKRGEIEDFAFDDAQMAFTDAEEDDPIIAAANAEALENDDDGFYGQEFGFFARASGSSESEYVNGGYFGPRTLEGVHRMNSGRDKFQEPSLTPITERSEWSNRNSTISLAMHGYPLTAQYPSNPQLASLVHFPEDKMSLEALQRLRRGAWNGSNGSLQSNSNSQNSSPLNYLAPGMMVPSLLQPTNGNSNINSPNSQNLGGSFHSFTSSNGHASSNDSDPSSSLDSPTITLSTTQPGLMMQPMGPPPPPPTETSPVRRNALMGKNAWAPRHRRNSSGAESVSYREEGGKWVCEKRRVDAAGEVEVLRRNFVERGRI